MASEATRGFEGAWLITGLPGEAPRRHGAVLFDAAARVVAVGAGAELRQSYPHISWSREPAILMPGLVNAHVHLELSKLRGETRSGGGFGPWLRSMMARRDALRPEEDPEAIEAGVSELLRAGTAAVGEVTNSLRSVEALATAPLLGRVFHELFGLSRASGATMRERARELRNAIAPWPRQLSYALSPHTLYSLHPEHVQSLVGELAGPEARTSLHLAEHPAERAFLRDGGGPFAEFLGSRGVPLGDFEPPGLGPVSYAVALGVLGPHVIAVHLADASRDELREVARLGARAVLCPRSNLYIELRLPPLFDILEAGLKPGLGTDSLASNTTLDVLAEAAALRDRFPQVPPLELISMATWYGAQALGLEHRVGALAPGLSPGLLAFDVDARVTCPLAHLLRSPPPARRVLLRPALPVAGHTLEEAP